MRKGLGRGPQVQSGSAGASRKELLDGSLCSSRTKALFAVFLSTVVLFSLSDLITTWVALGQGLSEGNVMLLSLSQFSGLSLLGTLMLVKGSFMGASIFLAIFGLRTRVRSQRRQSLALLAAFSFLLMAVTLNNAYLIGAV